MQWEKHTYIRASQNCAVIAPGWWGVCFAAFSPGVFVPWVVPFSSLTLQRLQFLCWAFLSLVNEPSPETENEETQWGTCRRKQEILLRATSLLSLSSSSTITSCDVWSQKSDLQMVTRKMAESSEFPGHQGAQGSDCSLASSNFPAWALTPFHKKDPSEELRST